MEASGRGYATAEKQQQQQQQNSFGLKKIIDCKIGEDGKQLYKVKWESTWEPAEHLVMCQHLINEFWSFVNKVKTNEEVAQQHRKKVHLEQIHKFKNVDESFHRISDDDKSEVQRLIARTNATSVGSLMSPSDLFKASPQRNQRIDMPRTPTNANNFPHSPQTPHGMEQKSPAGLQSPGPGKKSLNFDSPQQSFSSTGPKGKMGMLRKEEISPMSHAKIEGDDSIKNLLAKPSSITSSTSTSVKLLMEQFNSPYVDIIFVCKLCRKEQKMGTKWDRHFNTHSDERPFTCQECGKGFKRTDVLARHMKQVHSEKQLNVKVEADAVTSIQLTDDTSN